MASNKGDAVSRDSQRSKVYSAERLWRKRLPEEKMLDLLQIQEIAYKMVKHFGKPMVIHMRPGRGNRRATASPGIGWGTLTMPRWSRKMSVVCHEVAHLLVGRDEPWHGYVFCKTMIRVVREFMGPHEAAWLVEEYQRGKVKLHGKEI
jgi:hypothetical protein